MGGERWKGRKEEKGETSEKDSEVKTIKQGRIRNKEGGRKEDRRFNTAGERRNRKMERRKEKRSVEDLAAMKTRKQGRSSEKKEGLKEEREQVLGKRG